VRRRTLRCADVRLSLSLESTSLIPGGGRAGGRARPAAARAGQPTAHQTTQAGLPSVLSATTSSHHQPVLNSCRRAQTDGSSTRKNVDARLRFQFTASTRRPTSDRTRLLQSATSNQYLALSSPRLYGVSLT